MLPLDSITVPDEYKNLIFLKQKRQEKVLWLVTKVVEDKKIYKCKEYRITDPGDIIIGTEGNSSDDTVRLSGNFFFLTFKLIFDDLDLNHIRPSNGFWSAHTCNSRDGNTPQLFRIREQLKKGLKFQTSNLNNK